MKLNTQGLLTGAFLALTLSACTFTLDTTRTELLPGGKDFKKLSLNINDAGLDGGTQAYVNASFIAAVKQAAPNATMVAGGEDLAIDLEMLFPVFQPRWYTMLTLGLLQEYYQLGSMRIINNKTGEIMAIHTVTIKGKRVFPLNTEDYQQVIIPKLLELVKAELKTNGLARATHFQLDLDAEGLSHAEAQAEAVQSPVTSSADAAL